MPIPIEGYECSVCGKKSFIYQEIEECEIAPIEEPEFEIGDDLRFMTESNMMGVRYCYRSDEGKVSKMKLIAWAYLDGSLVHRYVYEVDTPKDVVEKTKIVMLDNQGSWVSPYEYRMECLG